MRKLSKKNKKTIEEHLEIIENLLAGILLKEDYGVKKIAKVIGISNTKITKLYPQKKKKSNKTKENTTQQVNDNG